MSGLPQNEGGQPGAVRRRLERLLSDRTSTTSPRTPTPSRRRGPEEGPGPAPRPTSTTDLSAAARHTVARHTRALRQGHTPAHPASISEESSIPFPASVRGRLSLLRRDTGLDVLPEQAPRPLVGLPAPEVYPSIKGLIGAREKVSEAGKCLFISSVYDMDATHGDRPLRQVLDREGGPATALLNGEAGMRGFDVRRALFLDIETTGLENAMGTLGFLVGAARFEGDRLLLEQWFLESPDHEAAMLADVHARIEAAEFLVTYNGRRFDLPLLVTRMRAHHMAAPKTPPHLDLLPASRRMVKHNLENCRLATVERDCLGVQRRGDVPGAEVPGIYRAFLHGGDPQPLVSVVSHNRDDVLSMVTLLDELLHRAEAPEITLMRDPTCALHLAEHAERLPDWGWAERVYQMAATLPELAEAGQKGLARVRSARRRAER